MGEVFGGRYELVDPLASGGSGVVWRVWDVRENVFRAAKVLKQSDSASLLRFMRETGWRINHPHVVTPLGWVGEDDRVMFTMPLVRGGSVSGLIKHKGALPAGFAAAITDQLLDALEKVHAQGLVHRDIKPANLLLNPTSASQRPEAMLTDFGIAAPVGEPRMTRVTEVIGTPGYMSPEAAIGLDPEPKQDLYSVGVVLLEMLTGQRPPKDGKPVIPPAAAEVPLGRFIASLLADEDARVATAADARAALNAIDLPTQRQGLDVPDLIPSLPEGWTEQGPLPNRPAQAPTQVRSEGFTPTQTRSGYQSQQGQPMTAFVASQASAEPPHTGGMQTGYQQQLSASGWGVSQGSAPTFQGPNPGPNSGWAGSQPSSSSPQGGPGNQQWGAGGSYPTANQPAYPGGYGDQQQYPQQAYGQPGQPYAGPGQNQPGQMQAGQVQPGQMQPGQAESVMDWFRSLTPLALGLLIATAVVFLIVIILLIV
ncbi:protein kinase domain-containing protein [Aestuariimicrobium soli]|uniref:protein kinase domain-containing protein n=1 Tax=Aestuariimicrobium soli TaxID=2035834 RepID=UPI003EBF6A7B